MESYKHSCPFCGQHVEYTAGYCGSQMTCPICGHTITFPALPPGAGRGGTTLRLKRQETVAASSWFDLNKILASIRGVMGPLGRYEHWNIVLVCLVPFVIVGVLVAGASYVKKQFDSAPAASTSTAVQADPNAWQKMTDLARAEQAVQTQVQAETTAKATLAAAIKNRDRLRAFGAKTELKNADMMVANAEAALNYAQQCFETAFRKYQTLGGTIDYRQRLPQ